MSKYFNRNYQNRPYQHTFECIIIEQGIDSIVYRAYGFEFQLKNRKDLTKTGFEPNCIFSDSVPRNPEIDFGHPSVSPPTFDFSMANYIKERSNALLLIKIIKPPVGIYVGLDPGMKSTNQLSKCITRLPIDNFRF